MRPSTHKTADELHSLFISELLTEVQPALPAITFMSHIGSLPAQQRKYVMEIFKYYLDFYYNIMEGHCPHHRVTYLTAYYCIYKMRSQKKLDRILQFFYTVFSTVGDHLNAELKNPYEQLSLWFTWLREVNKDKPSAYRDAVTAFNVYHSDNDTEEARQIFNDKINVNPKLFDFITQEENKEKTLDRYLF